MKKDTKNIAHRTKLVECECCGKKVKETEYDAECDWYACKDCSY